MYWLLNFVPKNHLSYLIGRLSSIKLPRPFSTWLVSTFARLVGIDCDSAELPVASYPSINDLFTRALKPGLRPIGQNLVSPIDGTLRAYGEINSDKIEQIKGINYSLSELLKDSSWGDHFREGFYFNLYLSPKDYHHVHFPIDGAVIESRYIPGKLWPVNDWSMRNIPGLFTVNERMITYINSEHGKIAAIMVGATNVGKISVAYDNTLRPYGGGYPLDEMHLKKKYNPPIRIEKGAKLGTFHLGSTVVLLLDKESTKSLVKDLAANTPRTIKYGESFS